MDPNTALKQMRRLLKDLDRAGDDESEAASIAEDMAVTFQGLDGWLSKGGFLPDEWNDEDDDSDDEDSDEDDDGEPDNEEE